MWPTENKDFLYFRFLITVGSNKVIKPKYLPMTGFEQQTCWL